MHFLAQLVLPIFWCCICISSLLNSVQAVENASIILEQSPPKLEGQSERQVWFLIPSTGSPQKFSLKCQASGNPERYQWFKDGQPFIVDGERITWRRPGQSGTIDFEIPIPADKGAYQCRVSNIFGTAVSDIFDVKQGVLNHFPHRSPVEVTAEEGQSLTLNCQPPYGDPKPAVLWLYRNTRQAYVIETVKRPHITVDGDGNLQFSHVEAHDGRENLLYQCAASSPVLQGEYRLGDEIKLQVISKDKPPTRQPHKLWCSPPFMNVTAGKELRLTCIFGGFPNPKVQWYKDEGPLPTDRMKQDDYGKTLIIDPVHILDKGTYVCRSGNVAHHMAVQVTAAPHWVNGARPTNDLTLPEDATAELECEAAGDPEPTVEWSFNGVALSEAPPSVRRSILDGGKTLRIRDLNHDVDMGVYQCNASNPFGYVFENAYLHILAHSPRFLTPVDQTIKSTVGSTVLLDCAVDAAPAPVVRWLDKKERPITAQQSSRIMVLDDFSLQISNAQLHDQNSYYCNVSNKYGIHRAVRRLRIYKPSVFLTTLSERGNLNGDERFFEVGEEIELSCAAECDERLSVNYKWLLNDRPVPFDEDNAYEHHEANRIKMNKARGRHSGIYKCIAQTDVDELVSSLKVVVRDAPEAPRLTQIDCNERRASIQWSAPFNNFNPITQYIVEYSTAFHPDKWIIALIEENPGEQETFEAIMTLSPWVSYRFRVTAVNFYGRGTPGTLDVPCSTPPSYPYTNPVNVSGQGTEPDNLVIYWEPMEKEEWNADDFRYLIKYRLDQPNSHWKNVTIEDPLADHAIIRDQPIFQKYIVQVIALNSVGLSIEEPKNVIGYSGEDVPTAAPNGFRILDIINSSAVQFTWEHVNSKSVMGHFQGYKIRLWQLDDSDAAINEIHVRKRRRPKPDPTGQQQLPDFLVEPGANHVTVTGFQPVHSYLAQVLAYNRKFEGPPSDNIQLQMPEGVPSEVTALKVEAIGAQTILSSWEEPEEVNGIVRGYYLSFLSQPSGESEETFVPAAVRYHVYDRSQPEATYVVSVWAETGGGQGPKLTQVATTWPRTAPGIPDLRVEIVGHNSARVYWVPSPSGLPGTSFYVNYSSDSQDWQLSAQMKAPIRDVKLTDLRPDTEYEAFLVALDGEFQTPSPTRTFRTKIYPISGEVVGGESLASATWFIAIVCAVVVALVSLLVICICQRNRGGKYPVKKKEQERGHPELKDEERSFMEYQYS